MTRTVTLMHKYRVEIFIDNNWRRWSTHKHEENARFNAESIHNSRKCDVRVIYQGTVILMLVAGKNTLATTEANGDLRH